MKNKRIIQAYDSINPSPVDKQRMLDAILQEANLEEAPRKNRKKKEPVIYTAKPTKTSRRSFIGTLAASLILFLIAGLILVQMTRQTKDPSYVEPTTETIHVRVNFSYSPVLEKYRTALREGWSKERCEIEGISTRFYIPEEIDFTIGQRIIDINRDGKGELLIGHDTLIWDMYTTLEDGTPVQLLSDEQDGWQYYISEDGTIAAEYYSKDDCYVEHYHLDGHQLVMEQQLQFRNGQWQMETSEQEWTDISEQEVQEITNRFEYWQPDWIPLDTRQDDVVTDNGSLGHYETTVAKYRQALDQGWDRTMCLENGMSELTPVGPDEGLYYAMFDLNGDGTEELIISEYPYRENTDTEFIDIYAMVDGVVRNVMSVEDEDMWSLCVHGYIKDISPAQRPEWNKYASYWQFHAEHFEMEFAVGQKDGQWFTEGYRGVGAAITREEADEIVANYPPQKLDFTEIQSSGETEYQSGYEVFDHILQKYVTAINEGWTAKRCEENDISPQILEGLAGYQNLGWCLMDIDSNGVEELIISDGVYLYDLYVMMPHDGGPGHVLCANGGETYQLCENGVIQNHGLYSGTTAWRSYTLVDIDMIQRDIVFYDGELNQYYYGSNGEDLAPITKDKAGSLINRERTAELTLTPFVERPAFWPDESEYYEPLLNIYRQAIRERWNPGDCVQQGISLMVGYYGDFVEELGYTTMDLDSNGIDELIITDGTNIYDLYTIIQDEETGPLRLVDAMERIEYFLTEDNMIYCSGSGGAGMHAYSLSSLEEGNLRLMTGFMYAPDTDPDNPWFHYDGENQGEPCGWDAQPIIDNWKVINIPYISFE